MATTTGMVSPEIRTAVQRARAAIAGLAEADDAVTDPLVVVSLGRTDASADAAPLIDWLHRRQLHRGRDNAMRYRWSLSWRSEPGSEAYRQRGGRRAHWRPAEREWLASDPTHYGQRLMVPITMAAHLRYWGRLSDEGSAEETRARSAAAMIEEALPVIEDDVASWFQALDPWRDTFGLWLLTSQPQSVGRLRDLLFSLAVRYGGLAVRTGAVRGIRYPFFDQPLVSASAHLAAGLWRMGVYPSVIPELLRLVSASRTPEGAWGDAGQPPDVLTTLAAADLLASLDPSYDPAPTMRWLMAQQEPEGWWRALDPEVPWLTDAVADWLAGATRPFPERFTWPTAPVWARDRLTGLTTVAGLDEIANVLERLSALGAAPLEAAFLDLAGFGRWNTTYGQSAGDDVLGILGRSLASIPGILAVRIGGDEFMLLGKPEGHALEPALDAWRIAWPSVLEAASTPAAVAPRILVSHANARDLRGLRHFLGDGIAALKADVPDPPAIGVLRTVEYRAR